MRVLVIGGTKFIGPVTVGHLIEAGHDVGLFNRGLTAGPVPKTVSRFQGDRLDVGSLRSAISDFNPDAVLDLCSFFESHKGAFENAAVRSTLKHVLVSSCDVYRNYGGLLGNVIGKPDLAPLTEESPCALNSILTVVNLGQSRDLRTTTRYQ